MERRAFLKMTGLLVLAGVMPLDGVPALPNVPELRLFLFDDCDWVAARSRGEAVDWYASTTGIQQDELEVDEVSRDGVMVWGEPGDDGAELVTFAEAIRRHHAEGVKFPEIVASTEF